MTVVRPPSCVLWLWFNVQLQLKGIVHACCLCKVGIALSGPRDAPTRNPHVSIVQLVSSSLVRIASVLSVSLHLHRQKIVAFIKLERSRITQIVGRLVSSASPPCTGSPINLAPPTVSSSIRDLFASLEGPLLYIDHHFSPSSPSRSTS